MNNFYSLDADISTINVNDVGSKAYNLMVLNQLNLNIPEGIVLTTKMFVDCQPYNQSQQQHLRIIIDSIPHISAEKLMIRSSAIGEDGEEHSFAGQLESYQVNNSIDDIIEGIINCWGSLTNQRVKAYQKETNHTLNKMGVIIQKMIEPDYAGVYFSAAPDNSDFQLIEYITGHCEKLVQGEVTPETIYLPSEEILPFDIKKLQQDTQRIKDFFGKEQDIEWLIKNDICYFVQARPITIIKKRIFWSSSNVNENYPNELSPLLYSIARKSYYHYFKNIGLQLKILKEGDGEMHFANIIGMWGERMYYNMTNIHSVIALTPLKNLLSASFDNFIGYQKQVSIKEKSVDFIKKINFLSRLIVNFILLPRHVSSIEQRVNHFTQLKIDSNSLHYLFHEFLDIRFNFWFHASFADFYAMIFHGVLEKFITHLKLNNSTGIHNTLVQAIPNLVSNKPIFDMWKIKCLIVQQGKIELFRKLNAKELWEKINQNPELHPIKELINAYLSKWGFRCTGELTFLDKNFIEDPVRYIALLKVYLSTENDDPEIQFHKKHIEQQLALKSTIYELHESHPFYRAIPYRIVLSLVVKWAKYSISSRERVRLKQAQMYFKYKQVCLTFSKILVAKGILSKEEDIFFLEYDEISRLLNFEEINRDYWQSLIKIRIKKFQQATEKEENIFNFSYDLDQNYQNQDAISSSKNTLDGLAACGGKITARAVVLNSIMEIGQLKKGDILVTKQTDPGWVCAFPIISGLVVERGGILSHGAIVAREFGIPAVLGIKGITTIIKTGDIIMVDGNQGIVECLKQS